MISLPEYEIRNVTFIRGVFNFNNSLKLRPKISFSSTALPLAYYLILERGLCLTGSIKNLITTFAIFGGSA